MESIYRRHNNSLRTIICLLVICLSSATGQSQVTDQYKEEITTFIYEKFPRLLETSSDYALVNDNQDGLRSSLSREISNIGFRINENMVIEYDNTSNDSETLVISDRLLPFLIDYAGRSFDSPEFDFECLTQDGQNLSAHYYSKNVTSKQRVLRKMIFREVDGALELRRISFEQSIPTECLGGVITADDNAEVEATTTQEAEAPSTPETSPALTQTRRVLTPSIPLIKITEARYINGSAYVYGYVLNHNNGGNLTDLDTSQQISISDRDGFFAFQKTMTPNGYQNLNLRYDYGAKFLTDKILIFVNSN